MRLLRDRMKLEENKDGFDLKNLRFLIPVCPCAKTKLSLLSLKNWGRCVLTWTDVGAVSYLCAVGVKNAFNVSLTIPPHFYCLATCKTDTENQRITKLFVKNGSLLFDE